MNKLDTAKRVQIISALVEGNSVRATVRMTGASKNAIQRLMAKLGPACKQYQSHALRNLPCKKIQCDEIWSFCYAKQKNVPAEMQGQFGFGDVWTWTSLCADTKLIVNYKIGTRGAATAYALMHDLAGRLNNRIQLTTDGHRVYADAVESAFGSAIDYAMLVKVYGDDGREREARYSPSEYVSCRTADARQSEEARHLYQLCGAAEPDHADADVPFHAAHERLFKESGKSRLVGCASLHALQLLPRAPDPSRNSGDGGRGIRPCLDN